MAKSLRIHKPSPMTVRILRTHMEKGLSIEMAAALVKIPRYTLYQILERGRAGDPDFIAVTEMIDEVNAELTQKVLTAIHRKAFEEDSLSALTFIYNQRAKLAEEHATKKQIQLIDEGDKIQSAAETLSDEDLDAIEKNLEVH